MSLDIIVIIIITSLATYISRFLGAFTSEIIDENTKIYRWFNYLAYSTLAALISRMIIFPAGTLAESNHISRLVVVVAAVLIYKMTKKNLVYPTFFSAIILFLLSSMKI